MRSVYLVTYDVSDEQRLRQTFKVMRRYGEHLQLSVFRCVLNERELARMQGELEETISLREDQVLVADLGPEEGRGETAVKALGRALTPIWRGAVVL